MKSNLSLLALVLPRSSPSRLLGEFVAVARWLNADLHLLVPESLRESTQKELGKLHPTPGSKPIVIQPLGQDPLEGCLKAVERLAPDFFAFEDGELTSARSPQAELKRRLLEQVPVPVLVLPAEMPERRMPPESLVVPISGEQRESEALTRSLELAEGTGASVTLVHVSKAGERCGCEVAGLESLGDQAHHEYVHQLDKVVSEASPEASLKERRRVTRFTHLAGWTPGAIADFVSKTPRGMLVLEWKGILINGHAATLKALLEKIQTPILIVKIPPHRRSTLRIGGELKKTG